MNVIVDTSLIRQYSKNLQNRFQTIESNNSNVNAYFNEIGNVWEGDSENFLTVVKDFANELPKLCNCLDSHISAINSYASRVESLDSEYAGRVINLV